MNSKYLRDIRLAYKSVYSNLSESFDLEEELRPIPRERMIRKAMELGERIPSSSEDEKTHLINRVEKIARVGDRFNKKASIGRSQRNKRRGYPLLAASYREDYDNSDIIIEYLMEEGYADDLESAEIIMENMSGEWMGEILEAYRKLPVFRMTRRAAKKGLQASQARTSSEKDRLLDQGKKIAKVAGEHDPNKEILKGIYARRKAFDREYTR